MGSRLVWARMSGYAEVVYTTLAVLVEMSQTTLSGD
jgi:hypothetical protein